MLLLLADAIAADAVLYYKGNGGLDGTSHGALEAAVVAAGATGVDTASTWPEDLSAYHLVVVSAPTISLDDTQLAQLLEVHDRGDVVLLVSEAGGGPSPVLEDARTALGISTAFVEARHGSDCSDLADVLTTHDLTLGLDPVTYGGSAELSPAGAAVGLLSGEDGQILLVEEAGWVLAADASALNDGCTPWPGDNTTLIQNIFEFRRCDGLDVDGDGYLEEDCGDLDCNDVEVDIHPGAAEHCDGVDEDCDGAVDEAAVDAAIWFVDADGDGFGDPETATALCAQLDGYVDNAYDCDDTDAATRPFAPETCDGVDEDCDGAVDEDPIDGLTLYVDADGDGYGDASQVTIVCSPQDGLVADNSDCDDTSALRSPGVAEICDEVDNDCDGQVDDGVATPSWYADGDGDGVGDDTTVTTACAAPDGFVAVGGDCDDDDPALAVDCSAKDTGGSSGDGCGCASVVPSSLWPGLLAGVWLVARARIRRVGPRSTIRRAIAGSASGGSACPGVALWSSR